MQQILEKSETYSAVRNYGVDSIKIVSMFMVVVLHVLGQGGILKTATFGTANYALAWCLEIAAFCAVNCFALTSGYLSVGKEVRFSKLILLWLQVAFYSVGITFLFWLLRPDWVNLSQALHSFLPVLSGSYWYFTAYFGLFFFTPFLNKAFSCFDKALMTKLVITVFCLLSLLPLFTQRNLFELSKGYSLTWLCALYIIGAYIKQYQPFPTLKKASLGLYVGLIAVVSLIKLSLDAFGAQFGLPEWLNLLFVSYTSPFILLAAVFLFLFFSRLSFESLLSQRIVAFFAPISFGVYLIHTHPYIWNYILIDRFASYAAFHSPLLIASVFLTAGAIFLLCAFFDRIRTSLFRLCKIPVLCSHLESQLAKIFSPILNRLLQASRS